LVNDLPVFLEHVPLHQRQHIWFMCAWWGTTSFSLHCHAVPEPDFWLTVDRTRRPSQLACMIPNLNPLDFWLWGHLKTSVYSAPINDLEVLQQQVQNACQEIQVKPGIFDTVRNSVWRRAASCVEMHGNHIEHML
jgi:hypothetical protein